jgi:hypothetical protein
MAPNMRRGLLQVQTELQREGSVDRAGLAGGLATVASSLAQVGGQIGKIADHAAAVEGEEAGRLAGLDPEFRPTKSLTIRGEAYDKAGITVYGARAKLRFAGDLEAAYDAHKDDPQGLAKALDAKRTSWLAESLPEVRPELELMFDKARVQFMRQAARAQAARISTEQTAGLQSELGLALKTLQQRAYSLGLDEGADGILASDMQDVTALLGRRGVDGKPLVAPGQARKIAEGLQQDVATARLLGAFERTPSAEAKQAFLDKFRADFGKSEGLAKVYDLDGFRRIEGALEADLTRAASQRNVELRQLRESVKEQGKLAEKGFAPPPDQLATLKAQVANSADPAIAQAFAEAENLIAWQSSARVMPPAQLDALVLAERERLAKGGATTFEAERLALSETLLTNMRSELARDALGWADRVGLQKIAPLNLSDEVEAAASLRTRIAQAEEVGEFYGQKPQYLRPEEKRQAATLIAQGGPQALTLATVLGGAAGDRAPQVLAELYDEAPAVAMLGGLVNTAGSSPAARDAADGLALIKSDGFKPMAPSAKEARTEATKLLGNALADMPRAEASAITMANWIYEVRARRGGLTEFDDALWRQGLAEALGQRTVAGELYGGVVENDLSSWRSERKIVLPPDIRQSSWREVIDMLTPADLAAADLGNPVGEDGKSIPLDRIKNMTLVQMLGVGRYAVASDDGAAPGEERFVFKNKPGEPFVLDLGRLTPRLLQRRPDLFLGAGAN